MSVPRPRVARLVADAVAAVEEEHERSRPGRRVRGRLDHVAEHLDRLVHAVHRHRGELVVAGHDVVGPGRRGVLGEGHGPGQVERGAVLRGSGGEPVVAGAVEPVAGEKYVELSRVRPARRRDDRADGAAVGADRRRPERDARRAHDRRPVGGQREPRRRRPGDGVPSRAERLHLPGTAVALDRDRGRRRHRCAGAAATALAVSVDAASETSAAAANQPVLRGAPMSRIMPPRTLDRAETCRSVRADRICAG